MMVVAAPSTPVNVIDCEMTADVPRPAHIKERIRGLGPTVRPDLTLKPEASDLTQWVI